MVIPMHWGLVAENTTAGLFVNALAATGSKARPAVMLPAIVMSRRSRGFRGT